MYKQIDIEMFLLHFFPKILGRSITMLTRVLPTTGFYWNPGDLQWFCQQRFSPVFLGCQPQGDEMENAHLPQACCWNCPQLLIYKWRLSLHWHSAHEGVTSLHEPSPWCTEACSSLPSGSVTFRTPTELVFIQVTRDLGQRSTLVLTYLKMTSFGLYSTVELPFVFF